MKYISIVILSVLLAGCDLKTNEAKLKVEMTMTLGNDPLGMLGAQPLVFNIDYSGTANSAGLYIQAFKEGKLTKAYMSVGGVGGFVKPVKNLKLKIFVNIFDSRTSVMKLATQNKVQGDFYRFVSTTKYENTEYGGGDQTVSTDLMDISGGCTWGSFPEPDMSKEYIPVGYIKSTKSGRLSAGIPEIIGNEIKKEEGFERCNYLIFYLRLNEPSGPTVSTGGH